MENRATSFIGLTPEATVRCATGRSGWPASTLQDEFRVRAAADAERRPALGVHDHAASIRYGRDSALVNLTDRTADRRAAVPGPDYDNLSPRVGARGTCSATAAPRCAAATGSTTPPTAQQNLIVTVTNPPYTPRVVYQQPHLPEPAVRPRLGACRSGPVQWDVETPSVHVWNVNLQREFWGSTALTLGYAGSRGMHLLRSNDVNTAAPVHRRRRPAVLPGRHAAAEHRLDHHRAEEQRRRLLVQRACIVDLRRRWSHGVSFQSSYTLVDDRRHDPGLHVLLRRDQRHHLGLSRVHSRLQPRAWRTSTPSTTG